MEDDKIRILARQTEINRVSLSLFESFMACHAGAE